MGGKAMLLAAIPSNPRDAPFNSLLASFKISRERNENGLLARRIYLPRFRCRVEFS